MQSPQSSQEDLRDHWVRNARGPDGSELPANVQARWSYFSRQARRSRNEYFLLDALALMLAVSIPAAAAFGAGTKIAAVLGAAVVVASGLRQIGRFHEEWVSPAQAKDAIEREIVLFTWARRPYQGPSARARLAEEVERIAASEGQRFTLRRANTIKSDDSRHPA
jgi:hypothetical protein